jgi:exosortase A-associated hydrolase 2
MTPQLNPFFQPAQEGGQRLYLHHIPLPGQAQKGAVLYVHPWAEEMNKSRRMAALASRALAADGWAVLQVDLLGCGDSSGDFGDATWEAWLSDVARAAHWLQAHYPGAPVWLWGLRAGALLASAAASRVGGPLNLLFWQPALQGKALLQQFLRLKAAAQLADGGGKAILEAARAELNAGRPVEVAGYLVASALAQGLDAATLAPPMDIPAGRLVWLEVSSQAEPSLAPASQAALQRWQSAGWHATIQVVAGPPFWQTTEIEDAPALVATTVNAMSANQRQGAAPPDVLLAAGAAA